MKKCPECGNASYDGAPVCGNCGYKFPKPKAAKSKEANIFQEGPTSIRNRSNQPSTLEIIKEKKIIIGVIILITAIVICGIVISGNSNQSTTDNGNTVKFSEAGFSFNYPSSWSQVDGDDESHENAIYFDAGNDIIVEYYNVTSSSTSLKEINQERISYAQENGFYVDTVKTITLDDRNASDIILEDSDGDYIRYVSLFSNGKLYVYKITGESLNSVNDEAINNVINTSHIE